MKKFDISDDLKNDILTNLVEPQYKKDIIRDLKLRKKFKNYGLFFETLSKFFVGFGSIMSFSSGIYKIELLSFVAGTASVVSLVLLQYSSFSYREYKKISMDLNEILKKLNITTMSIDNL
jgi:membrane protein DedA with SNARE-associated domain